MTPRKVEVDPITQGSMLAPPVSLAIAGMVELEGGYYRKPETSKSEPTSEELALKAELKALFLLDKACTTKRNILNMESHQRELKKGNVSTGVDIETELARLASRDEKGRPIGAIPTSREHYKHFRRQAKVAFGESLGISTVIVPESRLVKGVPQELLIVRAEDPVHQNEFVNKFRDFDKLFGQLNQQAARSDRRQEINGLIRS